MGDEDDRDPLLAQAAHHLAEFLDTLGCQHGGGFIEDQHAFAAPQGPHDLHLLLLSQRQVLDHHIRVDINREHSLKLAEPPQYRLAVLM